MKLSLAILANRQPLSRPLDGWKRLSESRFSSHFDVGSMDSCPEIAGLRTRDPWTARLERRGRLEARDTLAERAIHEPPERSAAHDGGR